MAKAAVDVVRASFDAWNAGDLETYRALFARDVVWVSPPRWPEPGPFVGADAVIRAIERGRDAWDADRAEPIGEPVEDSDQVVWRFAWRTKGRGPQADIEMSCIYTIRGERIASFEFFWEHADALAAMNRDR